MVILKELFSLSQFKTEYSGLLAGVGYCSDDIAWTIGAFSNRFNLTAWSNILRAKPHHVVLPDEVKTLRDLLNDVSRKIHFELFDPKSGDLKDDFEIIINNKEIWFHPERFETQIQNGDTVEIYMVPLGGG